MYKKLKQKIFVASFAFIPSCKETARLSSLDLDSRLTWRQKWGQKIHLAFCAHCRKYRKHILAFRNERLIESVFESYRMPKGMRRRIAQRIQITGP